MNRSTVFDPCPMPGCRRAGRPGPSPAGASGHSGGTAGRIFFAGRVRALRSRSAAVNSSPAPWQGLELFHLPRRRAGPARQARRHRQEHRALAPAFEPRRFTDAAKVEKWFGRNCNDVLGRAPPAKRPTSWPGCSPSNPDHP